MTALKSNDVKNSIVARLLEIAPDCAVYTESSTAPRYPHIFVHEIKVSDDEQRKNRHVLTHSFDLRYRVASDPSTDLKLERNLEDMSLRLFSGLDIIPFGDTKIRCSEKRIEKTDGVLHFFFDVKVQALLMNTNESTAKQEKLGVEIEVRNG